MLTVAADGHGVPIVLEFVGNHVFDHAAGRTDQGCGVVLTDVDGNAFSCHQS